MSESIPETRVGSQVERFLSKLSPRVEPWQAVAVGGVLVLLIGALDFVTGPQISSSLFYLLPVLMVTHLAGRRGGAVVACGATLTWLLADLLPPSSFSQPWIPFWNALMRLGVFLVVVWLVSNMRALTGTLEDRVRDRTARLETAMQERLDLEKRILEISEREQARMGQDLHDGLCQHLVGISFLANLLQRRLKSQAVPESEESSRIVALLDEAITQARRLARGLYPVRLEEEGLVTALRELVDRVRERGDLDCVLDYHGSEKTPGQPTEIHLYRIAQEALNNAVKHARARWVGVHLEISPDGVELRVEDDGVGLGSQANRLGMGMHIMEYRARMIGASFHIGARDGGGTVVRCHSRPPEPAPKGEPA